MFVSAQLTNSSGNLAGKKEGMGRQPFLKETSLGCKIERKRAFET